MRFLSVCSGIEAASVKRCARCGATKPLGEFHRQPRGPQGRHSWCKPCANKRAAESHKRTAHPAQRRRWSLHTRYRLTVAQFDAMLAAQGGLCAICGGAMKRPCVDHDHATKKVRALLCFTCNLSLGFIERRSFLDKAAAYLRRHA